MPAFDKRIGDFQAANTQVLGISTDSPFSHDNWARSVGISHYPLLSDIHRTVSKDRSEEHTSELQSLRHLVCRLLLEKKKPNVPSGQRDVIYITVQAQHPCRH